MQQRELKQWSVHNIKSTQDIKEEKDVKETFTWKHSAAEQTALVQVKIIEIVDNFNDNVTVSLLSSILEKATCLVARMSTLKWRRLYG